MRNKLLGTIAAIAAGAGATLAQSGPAAPPPPMPIGPAGMPSMAGPGMGGPGMGMGGPGMVMPANGTVPVTPGVPNPQAMSYGPPGSGMPAMNGMGAPPELGNGGGVPGYPPGLHGQPQWSPPAGSDGLFGAPTGVNSRLAPRTWLTLDYLLWFGKSQPSNFPLLTTSGPAAGGVPGNPSTQSLVGTDNLGYNRFSGFRAETGFYCDPARRFGLYLGGFLTEQRTNITSVSSDATGQPLYARPFINAATGLPDVLLVSFPTFASGSAQVTTSSFLYGAEGGSWTNLYRSCPDYACLGNLNFIGGFRYLELYENLRIQQQTNILPGASAFFDGKTYGGPATIGVFDEFEVHNRFYGGQVGLNGDLRYGRWYLGGAAKLALGVMNERSDIRGFSSISAANTAPAGLSANSVVPGGLYANANTIGRFNNDQFAVIPEFSVNLGYTVTSWLTATVGYNYLYVSRVARPGDQVTHTVDPSTIPTSASFGVGGVGPIGQRDVVQSSYWMQGVNFGLVLRY